MRNSGIVIEQVSMEEASKSDEANEVTGAEESKNEEVEMPEKLCGEQYVKIEQAETVSLSGWLLFLHLG